MKSILDLPLLEVDKQLWRYEGNDSYRYILEYCDKKPLFCEKQKVFYNDNSLVCIGANSSTAIPGSLDPTLKTIKKVAKENGYDGFIMLNLSPIRATNPNNLPLKQKDEMYWENIEWIEGILKNYRDVYCAWGNLIEKRPYMNIFKDLNIPDNINWLCRGAISKKGHPHHPLYVKDNTPLLPFPMKDYLKQMRGE